MDSLLFYFIRSLLVSGLLTGYYVLALRDKRMHGFNRFYLLASVALALVLPLIRIGWDPWRAPRGASHLLIGMQLPGAAGEGAAHLLIRIGIGLCALVAAALLTSSAIRIIRLYRLKKRSFCRSMDGYDLVETDAPGTPFSFLRNLFWRQGADTEDAVNRKMLAHELAHIHGRHSWDILGLQTVLCIFWMNPFFWFIRRELTMVLEYIADAASGAEGDPEGFARMLLQAFTRERQPDLSTGFFNSPIKRRLAMITMNHRPRRNWMRKAITLPVLATAVVLFSCSKDQSSRMTPSVNGQDHAVMLKIKRDDAESKLLKLQLRYFRIASDGKNTEDIKKLQDSVATVYFTVQQKNKD
jgi:hypothetical protein